MWSLIWNKKNEQGHYQLEDDDGAHSSLSMLIADLRSSYGVSWYDFGNGISYEEGVYLIADLLSNTDTRFGAYKNGFSSKFSLTDFMIADLVDFALNFGKSKNAKTVRHWARPTLLSKITPKADKSAEGTKRPKISREEMLAQIEKIKPMK